MSLILTNLKVIDMKILEYLFTEAPGATTISDSSGQNNDGEINPVRADAEPARVVNTMSPPGYASNSLRYNVDLMPTSHGGNVEPDDQLQFLSVPVTPSILNINTTRQFTISFWAYHEVMDTVGNPWDGPQTPTGKDLFCPQHCCGAEAFYIFVRTKNLGVSVPVSERGELAFTGDGPAIVQAGGIDTTGLGGTTSQGYHVAINRWVHIACVLQPPAGINPGKWQIYADGVLVGEEDALPGLADTNTKIFSTNPDGTPAIGVDMRFGNFRGDFIGGVQRPQPIAIGANDYAYNGYLTGIRMYDHAQTQTEICADIATDSDTPSVESYTPSINFGGIAEGLVTVQPIEVEIKGCSNATIQASFVGAAGPFGFPVSSAVAVPGTPDYGASNTGTIWISYSTESIGSNAAATIRIQVMEAGFDVEVPILASTIARPSVSAVLVLDRSGSMGGGIGVPGLTKADMLREAARTFVNLMRDGDRVGIVRYNNNAPPPHFELTDVGPEDLGIGRANAIAYINGAELNPLGSTSIGDGVFEASNVLSSSTDDIQAMIVMTDGIENTARFLADPDVQTSLSENTYAIGLGQPSNISTGPLNAIVRGNDTYMLITGDIDINNRFKLIKYYTQILSDINNMSIVVDPGGVLTPLKTQTIFFSLNETDVEFDMILLTENPELILFELEAPNGMIISADDVANLPNAKYVVKEDLAFYRFRVPVFFGAPDGHIGKWKANIKMRTSKPQNSDDVSVLQRSDIQYSFLVRARTSLELKVSLTQPLITIGAPIFIEALVSEYGLISNERFNVKAELTQPNGLTQTLTLDRLDNGCFGLNLDQNVVPGVYTLRVLARGFTLKGNSVEREKTLTGVIVRDDLPADVPSTRDTEIVDALGEIKNTLGILFKCCLIGIIILLIFLAL